MSDLLIEYQIKNGGAELLRVYDDTPQPVLPAALGTVAVTALGNYCFAERQRGIPAPGKALCWPRPFDPAAEHRICGGFLQAVSLPDSLQTLGNCAFYDCRQLRTLTCGAALSAIGSDLFANDSMLHRLYLRGDPAGESSLFRLVNSIQNDLRAAFVNEKGQELAALHYPEYWEELEENGPAHIFMRVYSSQGYHYRQCFSGHKVNYKEYDSLFPNAQTSDPPQQMVLVCLERLRYPIALSEEAAEGYRTFLQKNILLAVQQMLPTRDSAALRALLQWKLFTPEAAGAAAALAAKSNWAEGAALLTAATQRTAPQGRKKYQFDEF